MDMNEIYLEKYVGEKEYGKFEDRWKFCPPLPFGAQG